MNDRQKKFVALLILGLMLFHWLQQPAAVQPPRIQANPNTIKRAASVMRTISDELDLAAAHGQGNYDEYIIQRCQQIFDERSQPTDFVGTITKPIARMAIRPVVTTVIRLATDERNFTNGSPTEEQHHE